MQNVHYFPLDKIYKLSSGSLP
ncbi:hypothetical protein EMIT07CA2_40539 [Brevibacillus sp. IT-7CA2]